MNDFVFPTKHFKLLNEDIKREIQDLREKYKQSAGVNRKIIEIRGKALKIALEKRGVKL